MTESELAFKKLQEAWKEFSDALANALHLPAMLDKMAAGLQRFKDDNTRA
jgi:hypothetical protein